METASIDAPFLVKHSKDAGRTANRVDARAWLNWGCGRLQHLRENCVASFPGKPSACTGGEPCTISAIRSSGEALCLQRGLCSRSFSTTQLNRNPCLEAVQQHVNLNCLWRRRQVPPPWACSPAPGPSTGSATKRSLYLTASMTTVTVGWGGRWSCSGSCMGGHSSAGSTAALLPPPGYGLPGASHACMHLPVLLPCRQAEHGAGGCVCGLLQPAVWDRAARAGCAVSVAVHAVHGQRTFFMCPSCAP